MRHSLKCKVPAKVFTFPEFLRRLDGPPGKQSGEAKCASNIRSLGLGCVCCDLVGVVRRARNTWSIGAVLAVRYAEVSASFSHHRSQRNFPSDDVSDSGEILAAEKNNYVGTGSIGFSCPQTSRRQAGPHGSKPS
jgi:hypothetical protein